MWLQLDLLREILRPPHRIGMLYFTGSCSFCISVGHACQQDRRGEHAEVSHQGTMLLRRIYPKTIAQSVASGNR